MLPRCVTVIPFHSSRYSGPLGYVVAHMMMLPDEDIPHEWVLTRIQPTIYSMEQRAVAEACLAMAPDYGPFLHYETLSGSESYDRYVKACERLGYFCLPAPMWLYEEPKPTKESTAS